MDPSTYEAEHSVADAIDLEARILDLLKEAAKRRRLARGEVLIEEGSEANSLYFVLSGRFAVIAGETPIAEIGSGEPVGEIAFFGGGERSASVVATRASDVLELSREAYNEVLTREPDVSTAIISALARRLRSTVTTAPRIRPRPAHVVGVLPGGGCTLDPASLAPIMAAFRDSGATVIASPEELGTDASVADLVLRGGIGQRVVLLCSDPANSSDWANEVYQQSDTLVICMDQRQDCSIAPSPLEREVTQGVLQQNVHLVFIRHEGAQIAGTGMYLNDRTFGLHHHLELGSKGDAERIVRLIEGKALGVVFGGGGAFGTAHLAILKALREAGIKIDMVGGTSVGAAMAGAFAMGLSMDEVMDRFVEMFVTSKAATRYTLPFWSIMDHTPFDAQLQYQYGESLQAEDLPINYYALATSLTRNAPVVLRRGAVWRLIRASSAIPAVFPPMVMEDGEVFVDGGLFDNVPVQTMRELKAGPNLVLRLEPKSNWRVHSDYSKLPGRGGAMRRVMLGGRGKKHRFPSIASVMTRSLVVNSEMLQATVDQEGDVFLDLPRIPGMGFMQWEKGRALFDKTYAQTAARLDELTPQHSGFDLLRALAEPRR